MVRPMRRPQLQTLFVSSYERIRPKAYNWLTRIRIDAATRSIERYKLVCFGKVLVDDQKDQIAGHLPIERSNGPVGGR